MKPLTLLSFKAGCLAFASFLLLSCECTRTGEGVVLDETTHLPIDSVLVKGIDKVYNEMYTDSTGSYFMTTGMTGAVGDCPNIKISFSKEGYHSQMLINPEGKVFLKSN